VDPKIRKLAVARLWLMKREGNVDKAIADLGKIAPELTDHPGLIYERMRWRRRKGRTVEAADLLKDANGDPERPDKWWKERAILARSLLQDNKPKQAYDITSHHGLSKEDAAAYSDAEWMSGWIALRFLKDPARGLKHFQNMLSAVSYPISIARGAYWSARAANALGQKKLARAMLQKAAAHPTTYYGQLARARLGQNISNSVTLPAPNTDETARFNAHPLKRASSLLWKIGLHWTCLNKVDSTFEIYQRYLGGLNDLRLLDADGQVISYEVRGKTLLQWCGSNAVHEKVIDWFVEHGYLENPGKGYRGKQASRKRTVGKLKNRYRYFTFSPETANPAKAES